MAVNKLKIPSVFAFSRKLNPSHGAFFSGVWDNADSFVPVRNINQRGNRGVSQNSSSFNEDAEKMIQLSLGDSAFINKDHDTLKIEFSLSVIGDIYSPHSCNDPVFGDALKSCLEQYHNDIGLSELSHRYATNIANGRWLWRNRLMANNIRIVVTAIDDDKNWEFDAFDFSLNSFDLKSQSLSELSQFIKSGFDNELARLSIVAYLQVGKGQEVFPSQELIFSKGSERAPKTLCEVDNCAAMHPQKIGNALRTIDDWHNNKSPVVSVETFASSSFANLCYRSPQLKNDFYSLLKEWVIKGNIIDLESRHFVVAVLIRGGVLLDA